MTKLETTQFVEKICNSKQDLIDELVLTFKKDPKIVWCYVPKTVKEKTIICFPGQESWLEITKEQSVDNSFIYCIWWVAFKQEEQKKA